MKEQRYTISKEIAEGLQLQGWTLVRKFYDKGYLTDIYHLERDKPETKKE